MKLTHDLRMVARVAIALGAIASFTGCSVVGSFDKKSDSLTSSSTGPSDPKAPSSCEPAFEKFQAKVQPILLTTPKCTTCHAPGKSVYVLSPTDLGINYQNSKARINVSPNSAADQSLLVLKVTGTDHDKLFETDSPQVAAMIDWIKTEAKCAAEGAVLKSVSLSPTSTILKGVAHVQMTLYGNYSDKTQKPITSGVSWKSVDEKVLTVDASGLVSSLAVGTASVKASYQDFSDTQSVQVIAPALTEVHVTPTGVSIYEGMTYTFAANGVYEDGTTSALASVNWSTSDLKVATVSNGVVTALKPGTVDVTAEKGGIQGSVSLKVLAASKPYLTKVVVSPGSRFMRVAQKRPFTAQGTYYDPSLGTTKTSDITALVSWSVSAASVASIETSGASVGWVTGKAEGTTQVTAKIHDSVLNKDFSAAASAQFLICPSESLFTTTVQPLISSTTCTTCHSNGGVAGSSLIFSEDAHANYTNIMDPDAKLVSMVLGGEDKSLILTKPTQSNHVSHGGGAKWDVGDSNAAAVRNWLKAEIACKLSIPQPKQIVVTPTNGNINAGLTLQMKATAKYTNDADEDITSSVDWSTDFVYIAKLNGNGLLTGLKKGQVTVTASSLTAGVSGTAVVQIGDPILNSVKVNPASADVDAGATPLQLTLMGSYSDGADRAITAGVSWASNAPAIATVDSTTGKVTGVTSGTATITAKYGSTFSATSTIKSKKLTLDKIVISPSTISLHNGYDQQFTVKGYMSDSSVRDLNSDTKLVYNLSAGTALKKDAKVVGLIHTIGEGTQTVTAVYPKGPLNSADLSSPATVTVTPAEFVDLQVFPSELAILKGGADTTYHRAYASYSDGHIKELKSGISWKSSATGVATIDATTAVVSAKSTGATNFTVTYSTKSATAAFYVSLCDVDSTGKGQPSSYVEYKKLADPIIQKKYADLGNMSCVSCHDSSVSSSASSALPIVASPSKDADFKKNYQALLNRTLSSDDAEQTTLLGKATNRLVHEGGERLHSPSADYSQLKRWVLEEKACAAGIGAGGSTTTNLARDSGPILYLRLKTLFPGYGRVEANFDPMSSTGILQTIGSDENQSSSVAQIVLRDEFSPLCKGVSDGSDGKGIFKPALRVTETAPTDLSLKLALYATRNAWLSPYELTDPAVVELSKLYKTVIADAGATAADGRQAVCMATLLSPPFWLGNPGKYDSLRRAYLEVGKVVPTMADYDAFKAANFDPSFIAKKIQSFQTGDLRANYESNTDRWHRMWLGLRTFIPAIQDPRPFLDAGMSGRNGATGIGNQSFVYVKDEQISDARIQFETDADFGMSEDCDKSIVEDFEPRTDQISWYHFNPKSNANEFVGGFKKDGSGWTRVAGSITDSSGHSVATGPEDLLITFTKVTNGKVLYYYRSGKLKDTPVDGYRAGDRQMVRSFNGKAIRGTSYVNLWYTGEKVRVCNSLSRFWATCAYRPEGVKDSKGNVLTPYAAPFNAPDLDHYWNGSVGRIISGSNYSILDTIATPGTLDRMRCGLPDKGEIEKLGSGDFSDIKAYPLGYNSSTPVASAPPQAGLQALGVNVHTNTFFKQKSDGTIVAFVDADSQERLAIVRLWNQLHAEPYQLVKSIIRNNGDYRELLTADYSVGSAELDLTYRSQMYDTPFLPPDFSWDATDADRASLRRIPASTLSGVKLPWITSSWGSHLASENYVTAGHKADNEVKAKVTSGILSMAAFQGPVSGSMRTLAARYFTRLMCGQPNSFVPTAAQESIHAQFVRQKQNGVDHLDKAKGCFQCHINIDPLASALSQNFNKTTQIFDEWMGESAPIKSGRLGSNWWFGVRNGGMGPGNGAFLGQNVSGLKEVASVLADSDQFRSCVVRTTFKNVYMREPGPQDLWLIDQMSSTFKNNQYNYNKLIEMLTTTDDYLREN